MKVYNKSNKEQSIRITDRYGHTYTIFVQPGRSTELAPEQVSSDVLKFLKEGILEDITPGKEKNVPKVTKTVEVAPNPEVEENPSDNVEEVVEEVNESTDVEPVISEDVKAEPSSVYVCEICGNEYATEKGLAMHMNKIHKENK